MPRKRLPIAEQKDAIRSWRTSFSSSWLLDGLAHRFLEFQFGDLRALFSRAIQDRYVDRTDERFERGFEHYPSWFSTAA